MALAAFEKTGELAPGNSETVRLSWNARDIACYSDTAQCYVLEHGSYRFSVAANANAAHSAPAAVLNWTLAKDLRFTHDEVTGTPYRNLFTGSEQEGYRYDARGTEKAHIVYLHRRDIDGVPTVAEGTFPETVMLDEHTRETDQILDLEARGGTIRLDNYGLTELELRGSPGETVRVPVSMEKCYGITKLGFSVGFDASALELLELDRSHSVLPRGYRHTLRSTNRGADVILEAEGNLFTAPCSTLFDLMFRVKEIAKPGRYGLTLLPLMDESGATTDSFLDKQGHPMSVSLVSQKDQYRSSGGWSGVYQSVEDAGWQAQLEADETELADLTLLSGHIQIGET